MIRVTKGLIAMPDATSLLNQFLGQPAGAATSQPGQSRGTGGFNLESLLSGRGGLATGAVAGGLAGLLLGGKKPRKLAKSALKVGGVALIGGLAYKAWRNWQANKAPATEGAFHGDTPVADAAFFPTTPEDEENISRAMIRAMIAAAKADGHVSAVERSRISEQLAAIELSQDDRVFIEDELSKPLDIDAVAHGAKSPEQAAEIYTASLLAIDPDGAAERGYLAMLAARLNLDPRLIAHLHAEADTVVDRRAA